jgi:hypothetical protein
MTEDIEIMDRYDVLGISRPDPETCCKGQCEGTGFVPICKDDPEEPWHSLWLEAEKEVHSEDGWHFVTCPRCNGMGKEPGDDSR